ncbi:MAG: VCBS repeat-containing protein [Acidobacteriota bacterium]
MSTRQGIRIGLILVTLAGTALADDATLAGPYFTNVTTTAELTGAIGFRSAVADINGDGYPDLLLHRQCFYDTGDVQNKQYVFLNVACDGSPDPYCRRFVDFTTASGVRATRQGASSGHFSDGVVLADVDNDGDLDAFFFVYVHQSYTLNKGKSDLMLNDGLGHFTYAANSTFHNEPIYNTTDGAWLDYDNDGAIDLALSNYYMNGVPTTEQLYRGAGNGGFSNVTGPSGIGARTSVTYALSTFDWNNDGYMDLFVPLYDYLNTGLTCLHWRNNGNGTFTQVQDSSHYNDNCGIAKSSLVASFGSMPADYDNDGFIDFAEIYVHGGTARGKFSGPVRNAGGVFSWDFSRVKNRASEDTDITHDGDHQLSWFDFDGDTLIDYVIDECFYGTNNQIFLFKQDPDHTFRPVTVESGLSAINSLNKAVYDVIPMDYDRDGDSDLLVAFADDTVGVQLWRNDVGNTKNWTSITLAGAGAPGHANRAGIGARLEITASGVTQTREIDAGPGQHAPQAPLTETVGLAAAPYIDKIRVRWPSTPLGYTEWKYVPVNTHLTIREVCTPPGDPTGLVLAKQGSDIVLTWSDPAIAGLTWKMYRDTQPDHSLWGAPRALGFSDEDAAAAGIQHRDVGAIAQTSSLFYWVTAFSSSCGESPAP